MIEIYDNFCTDVESNELMEFYLNNKDKEFLNIDSVYSFKMLELNNFIYESFEISKKLDLKDSKTIRIQLIDDNLLVNDYMHKHSIVWSYVLFLNEEFGGGELIFENIQIKPKKNQLIVFSGDLPHKVNKVVGNRYTLVSFSNVKTKINYKCLI